MQISTAKFTRHFDYAVISRNNTGNSADLTKFRFYSLSAMLETYTCNKSL